MIDFFLNFFDGFTWQHIDVVSLVHVFLFLVVLAGFFIQQKTIRSLESELKNAEVEHYQAKNELITIKEKVAEIMRISGDIQTMSIAVQTLRRKSIELLHDNEEDS